MARNENGKRRILALERMFLRMRPWSMHQIMDVLSYEYGISVDRKTVYTDIMELTMFLPIVKKGVGVKTVYQIAKTADDLEERGVEVMPRIYDVFNKEDGDLIVSGTSTECAEVLGIQRGTFNTYVSRGGSARYRIVDATDDFVKRWNETVSQLRKLTGLEG